MAPALIRRGAARRRLKTRARCDFDGDAHVQLRVRATIIVWLDFLRAAILVVHVFASVSLLVLQFPKCSVHCPIRAIIVSRALLRADAHVRFGLELGNAELESSA